MWGEPCGAVWPKALVLGKQQVGVEGTRASSLLRISKIQAFRKLHQESETKKIPRQAAPRRFYTGSTKLLHRGSVVQTNRKGGINYRTT